MFSPALFSFVHSGLVLRQKEQCVLRKFWIEESMFFDTGLVFGGLLGAEVPRQWEWAEWECHAVRLLSEAMSSVTVGSGVRMMCCFLRMAWDCRLVGNRQHQHGQLCFGWTPQLCSTTLSAHSTDSFTFC